MLERLLNLFLNEENRNTSKNDNYELLKKRDNEVKRLTNQEQFIEFENKIKSEFKIEYSDEKYHTFFDYISSLFLVDMLKNSFEEEKITLPEEIKIIDLGAGDWTYVNSLYCFLENYHGKRKVSLNGIDIKGESNKVFVERIINKDSIKYVNGNLMNINEKNAYDIVFMAHMLRSKEHFKKWHLKYVPETEIFKKSFDILKNNGLFVGIAYNYGGEASIFNAFPKNKKILDKYYSKSFGELTNYLWGHYTFDQNVIILGKN
jgi:hypothetical protein